MNNIPLNELIEFIERKARLNDELAGTPYNGVKDFHGREAERFRQTAEALKELQQLRADKRELVEILDKILNQAHYASGEELQNMKNAEAILAEIGDSEDE